MNQPPKIQNPKSEIQIAVGLFLVLSAFIVLTMGGHTYSRDEETMFATSEALAQSGQFILPKGLPVVDVVKLADGSEVSKYGPLKPILQLPIYWLGSSIGNGFDAGYRPFINRMFVGIFNPLTHAAIAALLFLFAVRLGYRRRVGYFVALLYAFATFAWPHSRTEFAEPLSALLMFASLYFAWRGGGDRRNYANVLPSPGEADSVAHLAPSPTPPEGRGRITTWFTQHSALNTQHWVSGLLMSAALATKFQNLIIIPVIFAYVVWLAWRGRGTTRWWLPIGGWLAGFVVGYIPLGLYNLHFFGGFFSSGYGDAASIKDIIFAIPINEGLYDLLLSPGKGLLWFAPPVLLLPFAVALFWRRDAALLIACIAVLLVHVLFYAMNRFWHADGSWGPRYLMPTLPFALLPLAALIERLWPAPLLDQSNPRRTRLLPARAVVILVAALGLSVQLFGSAVNFDSYINQTYADHGGDTGAGDQYRYFTIEGSPLFGQARMLAARIAEWQPNLIPPANTITLASGFSISEGQNGAPFPRWTNGAGMIKLSAPSSPFSLTLTLTDHRPPSLPRASVQVIADYGAPAAQAISGTALPDGISKQYRLAFVTPTQSHTIAILSDTWNPWTAGIPRDETIGIDLTALQPSVSLPVVGATLPTMPQHSAKQRFDWFYRPGYDHLLDLWRWYVAYSGLSADQQERLAAPIYISCGAMLILGIICFLPLRRRGQVPPAAMPT